MLKSLEGETGGSRRNDFYFSFSSDRLSHKCLSVAKSSKQAAGGTRSVLAQGRSYRSSNSLYGGDNEKAGSYNTSASTPVTSSSSELERLSSTLSAKPEEDGKLASGFSVRASELATEDLARQPDLSASLTIINTTLPRQQRIPNHRVQTSGSLTP